MVYDCFPFFNELDLLEIRLNELDGVVDRFVLAEGELTHNGERKPLYFAENKARFAKFADRIIHVVVTERDFEPAKAGRSFQECAWMRENIQRNAVAGGLRGAAPDDVVILSDLDEIPSRKALSEALETLTPGEVTGLQLANYNFCLNLLCASRPVWGNDPKLARFADFSDEAVSDTAPWSHFILPDVNRGATATRFRYARTHRRVKNAGWHFSYCGGVQAVIDKVKAFNEVGLFKRKDLSSYIRKRLSKNRGLFGMGDRLIPVPLDSSFPEYVLENSDRLEKYLIKAEGSCFLRAIRKNLCRTDGALRRLGFSILFNLTPQWLKTRIKRFLRICLFVLPFAVSPLFAAEITSAQALRAAQSWIDRGMSMGKMRSVRAVSVEKISDSSTGAEMHVVKLQGGGFVVTSADDLIEPVIAFSPSGDGIDREEANPLWALLKSDLAQRRAAYAGGVAVLARSAERTQNQFRWDELLSQSSGSKTRSAGVNTISDIRVDSFVKSKWNQGNVGGKPFFNFCTPCNYVCGCVATMAGQIMRYWQWPKSPVTAGTHLCVVDDVQRHFTMTGGTYSWEAMPLQPGSSVLESERQAVGKLMYDIGVSVGMMWTKTGSGATLASAQLRMADTFGYANSETVIFVDRWPYSLQRLKSIVIPNCDARAPVGMDIYGSQGGHAVIVDGYGYSGTDFYIHLNMGWSGSYDLWYSPPAIDATVYKFDVIRALIFNIFPESTGSVCSGRVLNSAGEPIPGASVTLKGYSSVVATARTDSNGIYHFIISQGIYSITAQAGNAVSSPVSFRMGETKGTYLKADGYGEYNASKTPSIANVYDKDITLDPLATCTTKIPVPYSWLDGHFPDEPKNLLSYEELAIADRDGDGYSAWEEYAANSDPNDPKSFLRLSITMESESSPSLEAAPPEPRQGFPRVLQGKERLSDFSWTDLSEPSMKYRFYRLKISLPGE